MTSQAHHQIQIDVFGAVDDVWVIQSHYCSDDVIGERSVCKRVRDEAESKGVRLGHVSAKYVSWKGWEARAEAIAMPGEKMVLIEEMPEHLCASHEASGNWGTYPDNGAERRRVTEHEAHEIIEADVYGYVHIVGE